MIVLSNCRIGGRWKYRWRSTKQKAKDHDHSETAGDFEISVQYQSETSETRARATFSGHRTRYARGSSLVSKQVGFHRLIK